MNDLLVCCFECGEPADDTMISVEMNLLNGEFVAHQNHAEYDHAGLPIHAERAYLGAHQRCYKAWYEQTYRSPFTMSA